jgi:glycerophosphoryl diester phosphodiesterase
LVADGRYVLLLGHRGAASAAYPENTLAAVDRAFARGADGVEVDVRLTRDGRLVCLHDPSLARVAGVARDLWSLSAEEVAAVRLPGGHPLPPLAAVLVATVGRGRLVVELKTERGRGARTAVSLAASLERCGVTRRTDVVVSSFDHRALGLVRRWAAVRTAVLTPPGVPATATLRHAVDGGHDEAHPHVTALLAAPPSLVGTAHALGVGVTAWTANDGADLRLLRDRGVDAAICDDPAAARAALTPTGARR